MSQYAYLAHHGIKGMKWGIRRYQNPDGSLTPEGEKRYYSYEGAKRAKAMSRAGVALGLGSGAVSIASMMGQAIHEDKLPEDIKNSKTHKAKAAAGVTASGIGGIAGMTSGMLLQAKSDSMLDKIIKNSSKEEFDKIKNDKRFANNSMVKTRAHFDNFEKLNRITKNMSNKQKAEIYVKNEFKKKNKYWTPDDSEGAWYNAKLAGNWYGLSDKEMEKLCWKYEKQNNPDLNHSALQHHGILGQKWGIRRYQNPDGSLTEAGKKRYTKSDGVLKSNAYGEYGIDTNAYYNSLRKEHKLQEVSASPYKSKRQNGKSFNWSIASDELSKMCEKGNNELGLKGNDAKFYSFEEVEEYLLQNYKDYIHLDDDEQYQLIHKLSEGLVKKGFHWID